MLVWGTALLIASLAVGSQVVPALLPPRPIPVGLYNGATLQSRPTRVAAGTELKFQLGDPAGAYVGRVTTGTALYLSGTKVDMSAFAQFVSTTSAMHTVVQSTRAGEIAMVSLAP